MLRHSSQLRASGLVSHGKQQQLWPLNAAHCQPGRSGAAATPPRHSLAPQQQPQQQQRRSVAAAAFQFKQEPEPADRMLAAVPYLLPLLDVLPYGACCVWATCVHSEASPQGLCVMIAA